MRADRQTEIQTQRQQYFASRSKVTTEELDSMRWFSHRRRTGGRHNCITYLLMDVVAWPTATLTTPTSVCWFFG